MSSKIGDESLWKLYGCMRMGKECVASETEYNAGEDNLSSPMYWRTTKDKHSNTNPKAPKETLKPLNCSQP
jgi:hypothetical protein